MIVKSYILVILLTIMVEYSHSLSLEELTLTMANLPEDGRLQFCPLAEKYGYACIRYTVTTEDGYKLGVFNVRKSNTNPLKCKPVLLIHGLADSSDTFIVRTNTSLVASLADQGYDVWLGNMRGNKHSREHESLKPEGLKFWEFSFHEIAIYDMPAVIDFVLHTTGQNQLQAIGHSLGTTVMFALGAMKPEYNDKVNLLMCLSPVVYLHNSEPLFPISFPVVGPVISSVISLMGHGEVFSNSSELIALVRVVCTEAIIGYEVCVEGVAFTAFERGDREQLEPEFSLVVFGHIPCGASSKNCEHMLQIAARREFAQYNYGLILNQIKYNSVKPPIYDLSKVTMKTALFIGPADTLTDPGDIQLLRSQLPNEVFYHVMERETWNHLDFVWGKDMNLYLFGYIHDLLTKYC